MGPGRASGYGRRIAESLARADEETLVAVQIETRAALDVLDEILGVDGVDLIFVGPGDLSVSLGLAGGLADPRLRPVVEDVLDRAAAAGKATGVFAADVEGGAGWLARGVGLVLVGSDLGFLAAAVEHAWRSLDDAPPPP
jgi:4-hydroxy-2-oxoheptanedioate aldolase